MVPLGSTLSRQAPTSVELDRNGLCPKYFLVLCLRTKPSRKLCRNGLCHRACRNGLCPKVVSSIRFPLPFESVPCGGPSGRVAPLVADNRVGVALSGGMISQCHVDHKTVCWPKPFSDLDQL